MSLTIIKRVLKVDTTKTETLKRFIALETLTFSGSLLFMVFLVNAFPIFGNKTLIYGLKSNLSVIGSYLLIAFFDILLIWRHKL